MLVQSIKNKSYYPVFLICMSFIAWGIVLLILTIIPHLSFQDNVGFLRKKRDVLHLWHWKSAFYIHIFSSIPVIVIGFLQFFPVLWKKHRKLHAWSGKLYVGLILFISGPTGLWMAFYANGGLWGVYGLVFQGLFWFAFTYYAYIFAVKKSWKKHTDMMIYSYAMTLSAVSFRFFQYSNGAYFQINPDLAYKLISWVSWLFNIGFAWVLIKAGLSKRLLAALQKKHGKS